MCPVPGAGMVTPVEPYCDGEKLVRGEVTAYNVCVDIEAPSNEKFVIQPTGNMEEIKKRLGGLGSVQPMQAPGEGVVLQLVQPLQEPKSAWQAIRDAVGENVDVHPVLLDSGGDPHYPTGRITVRFSNPPEDSEVEEFAQSHNLETRSKNKFIPSQFVFEPRESSNRYLPDVLNKIRSEKSVKAAWANTLSEYKRI